MNSPGRIASIETLLQHQDWVRAVARTLVWSGQDPEDLEQKAWLAALEHPPRDETLGRNWLGTVLRRAAARVVRTDSRRRAREMVSARIESSTSAADLVATAELQEKLVRKVLSLAEPYRETILLRFYEGLSIRQIAKRMTAPVETVRSRLHRGLRQLRADFKASDREDWRLLLLPLAGAPALKAGSSIAAGLLLVLLATSLSLTVWIVGSDRFSPPAKESSTPRSKAPSTTPNDAMVYSSPPGSANLGATSIAPRPFVEQADLATETRPTTQPALVAVPAGSGRLELQLLDDDGRPVAGRAFDLIVNTGVKTLREIADEEEVLAHCWGDLESRPAGAGASLISARLARDGVTLAEALSDRDGLVGCNVRAGIPGRLRLCPTPVGWRGVKVREEMEWLGRLSFDAVPDGETRRLPPLTLPRVPLLVAGRVETQSGVPVAGIIVHALLTGPDAAKAELTEISHRWIARTDAAGQFRIEAAVPATTFLAWAHQWGHNWKSISPVIPFKAGETNLVIRTVGDGAIKGRVRSATGPGDVSLALAPEGVPPFHVPYSFHEHLPIPLEVNENGDFTSSSIVAGTYRLEVMVGISLVRSIPAVVIEPGKVNADSRFADLLVGEDLRPGVVTVVDEEGHPVSRARVFLRSTATDGLVRYSMTSFTDGKGETSNLLPEGVPSMSVTVEKTGYLISERSDVLFPLRVTLERGAKVVIHLPGSRTLPSAEGVHSYWLCLVSEAEVAAAEKEKRGAIPKELHQSQATDVPDDQESFTLQGVRPDRYVVFLFPEQASYHWGSGDFEELSGGDGLELGRIDVSRSTPNEATYRVDIDRLRALITR